MEFDEITRTIRYMLLSCMIVAFLILIPIIATGNNYRLSICDSDPIILEGPPGAKQSGGVLLITLKLLLMLHI